MQIELFGCSSAGKSTLARRLIRASRDLGLRASMSEDFALRQVRLHWVRGRLPRTLLVDLLTLAACLVSGRTGRAFLRFACRCVCELPESVSWAQRLNTARNVFKKVGMREIVRRRASERELVVMDEGTLQTAHYMFVQIAAEPERERLREFLERVPLPEVAIYARAEEARLVRDTLARGHARIADRSRGVAALFVRRALRTFTTLADDPRVRERLWIVEGPHRVATPPGSPHAALLEPVLARLGAGQAPAAAPAPEGLQTAGAST